MSALEQMSYIPKSPSELKDIAEDMFNDAVLTTSTAKDCSNPKRTDPILLLEHMADDYTSLSFPDLKNLASVVQSDKELSKTLSAEVTPHKISFMYDLEKHAGGIHDLVISIDDNKVVAKNKELLQRHGRAGSHPGEEIIILRT